MREPHTVYSLPTKVYYRTEVSKFMATQSERRKNTRHAILDAAGKLFRKEGFDRTAVEDITSAANVAKGTFYQHFETKADVLLALVRRHEVETLAEVENALSAGVP